MSQDLSWRLQKLKERQERLQQQKAQKAADAIANRNSDSCVNYSSVSYQENSEESSTINSPYSLEEVVTTTYTNPNPVCRFSPLYNTQESSNNLNTVSSSNVSSTSASSVIPSFARRPSEFGNSTSASNSSRNSVYSSNSNSSLSMIGASSTTSSISQHSSMIVNGSLAGGNFQNLINNSMDVKRKSTQGNGNFKPADNLNNNNNTNTLKKTIDDAQTNDLLSS
ncbi:hypothetical protein DASC09_024140 [Saccharomycopsis crataegensis]|uniref:Uncharacterized protein n=1 Tax=Saccharomycopsis crataegensis TaxID=43959 RepID=A0AAV5QKE1_9ASCO|nr:hypothetical protein DASC09_024140 [Saccharomycopsis crataegensis]